MDEPTGCRAGPQYIQPQLSDPGYTHQSDTLPRQLVTRATVTDSVHTFPREQPSAPSNPGYTQQSDMLSRRPVTAVSDSLHAFPRSLEPACTQSTMTSVLPCQPAYMPTRSPTLVGPPPSDDVPISALSRPLTAPSEEVLTSALPRPLTLVGPPYREHVVTSALPRPLPVPADFAYDTMQRPVDFVDNRSNVYTNSVEQLLAHLPPPPPVNRQSVPLSSACTQTTASDYVNTDFIPHRYADSQLYVNTTPYSSAPLSQAIAFEQPGFSAFSRTDVPYSRSTTVQYTVGTSVSTSIAPLQSPSVHWRKRLAYDYIQPDTGLGAPTHVAPRHSLWLHQTTDV